MMTKRISAILSTLLLAGVFSSAHASHIPYAGAITGATGAVAGLLCGDLDPTCEITFEVFPDGVPFGGGVAFAGDGSINTLWFKVGSFFFSDSFTGSCFAADPLDPCVTTDAAYNGIDAFVPIRPETIMSTVALLDGFPDSGAFSFVAYSPTFGFDLGTVTGDLDAGTFSLDAGFLGGATGTGGFVSAVVPIPAAAWLFGSALLGLAGLRRRS